MSEAAASEEAASVSRRGELVVFGLLGLALLFVHGPLIVDDPLLARDDLGLIAPLERMTSVTQYAISLWAMGDVAPELVIFDVQPVRDLSYWLNLEVRRRTGLSTFHFTNVALWLLACWLVYRLLAQLVDRRHALGWVAVYALHPTFANSVAWVGARKHILAYVFILGTTLAFRRVSLWPGWRSGARVAVLYLLAVLSQPIIILWPLWAAASAWLRRTTRRGSELRVAAACFVPMVGLALLNYSGYSGPYSRGKFVGDVEGTFGVALLSVGRGFCNLVFPVALATSYYPGSWLNVLGLLGLVLFATLAVRRLGARQAAEWLLFFAAPFVLLTAKMTNIFLFDSYLLAPSLGLWVLLALLTSPYAQGDARRWILVGLGALATSGAVASRLVADTWRSDAALWAHAARVEPTPNALAKHAHYLALEGRTEEAQRVALRLREWAPSHPEAGYVLADAIFRDRRLSVDQKRQALLEHWLEDPWMHERLGLVLVQKGDFAAAALHLRQATNAPAAFRGEFAQVAAEAYRACELAQRADCAAWVATWRALPDRAFDPAAFEQALARLRGP